MRKITTSEFISKAKSVYGDRYLYDLVEVHGTKNKVRIVCRVHGEFEQTPNGHIYQGGCNKCRYISSSRKRLKSTNDFISGAKLVHGDRYLYGKSKYSGAHKNLVVTCRFHGDFLVTPNTHLKGRNCPCCRSSGEGIERSRLGFEKFVERATSVHGGLYEYPYFEYKNLSQKVRMRCKIHGDFYQIIGNHLNGCGCFYCKPYGFDSSKNAFLYVLLSDEFFKVGITSKPHMRIHSLSKNTPFRFDKIFETHGFGQVVRRAEKLIHGKFKSARLSGFDGCTEWFIIEDNFMGKIKEVCDELGLESE